MIGPFCACCAHVIRAGDLTPRHVQAAYVWVTAVGVEVLLCERCCAHWRSNAADDPSLEPERISSV